MTRPSAIMVMAAGLGTRMGALVADRPKPLIPVAGRPLIDHALDLTHALPGVPVVANVHYRAAQLRDHLAGRAIAISDETDLLRETGGGLKHARALLGPGPVITLNSDAVWTGDNPLTRLAAAWDGSRMDALLMLLGPEQALGHRGTGDFSQDGAGRLSRGVPLIYAGAQMLDPALVFAHTETVFSLNRVWDQMVVRGRLFGIRHVGGWCDVGRPESLPLADALLGQTHER
jgi:N-acetyl-alpha-D-muramate 1-phosphate uridylyltransferase